jgi:hypothetical protein
MRFRCDLYDHQPYLSAEQDYEQRTRFLRDVWTCHRLCMALEALYAEGLISRKEAAVFEEKFLVRADKDGRWLRPAQGEAPPQNGA